MQVPPAAPLRILALAGSLRDDSYNLALLQAAVELAPEALEITVYPLDDLPMYNGDVEAAGTPEAVQRFTDAIRAHDGLLISTPEYNASIPGMLKNAIDWASRPPQPTALAGKPTGIMGAASGMSGSMRAQAHLRLVLGHTGAEVMLKPEIYVAQPSKKFDADGTLTDEPTRALLGRFLASFETWVRRMGAVQSPVAAR